MWRRVIVDGSSTLEELHEVIQAAFGWWNSHLHEFEVGATRYVIPDPDDDWDDEPQDERVTRVDAVARTGSSLLYTYDFGDFWRHRITVEKVVPASTVDVLSDCIDGQRASPPEDSGGPRGYADLLAILADPNHPEHRERVEWVGGEFDPEPFDNIDFAVLLEEIRSADADEDDDLF